MKALLFLLAAMVVIAGTVAIEECSTKGAFPEYTKIFHSACVKHDRCYDRCPGKASCDDAFLDDMKAICKSRSSGFGCTAMAYTFYGGVNTRWAGDAYEKACGRRSR